MPLSDFVSGEASPAVKTHLNLLVDGINTNITDIAATDVVLDAHLIDTANPHDTTIVNLNDTTITAPADNDVLQYNTTGAVWENKTISGAGLLGAVANVGTAGVGVYKSTTSGQINLRNINAGSSNLSVTLDAVNDEVDLDVGTTGLTIGTGAAGVDYILTFDGETNNGTLTYMEDENRFDFSCPITTTNLTNSGLTITRVPYASTGGLLIDSASMAFDTTNGLILAAGSASALKLSDAGGTAVGGILFGTDTNLYRSAASTLKTDDALVITGNATISTLTATRVPYSSTGGLLVDSASMTFDATNGLILAAGSASALSLTSTAGTAVGGLLLGADTNLYRSAASTLKTDDALIVTGNLTNTTLTDTRVPFASTGGLLIDSASMTFNTTNGLILAAGSASALSLSSTAGTALGGILFGADANLYRSSANMLKTDDSLTIAGGSIVLSIDTDITVSGGASGLRFVNGTDIITMLPNIALSWSMLQSDLSTSAGVKGINFGAANTTNNSGLFRYVHNGAAAATSYMGLGFYGSDDILSISVAQNIVLGKQIALATNATDAFVYIPTCAGTPTGTPTAYTGKVAMVYDTTNHYLYLYDAGWKKTTVFA